MVTSGFSGISDRSGDDVAGRPSVQRKEVGVRLVERFKLVRWSRLVLWGTNMLISAAAVSTM